MKRYGDMVMRAVIYGDWQTVISSRIYRDRLIDQRPDEDMAEWHRYQIECKTVDQLVDVYHEFRTNLKLIVEFEFSFISDDRSCSADMQTGFDGDAKAVARVAVEHNESKIVKHVVEAIGLLGKAIE